MGLKVIAKYVVGFSGDLSRSPGNTVLPHNESSCLHTDDSKFQGLWNSVPRRWTKNICSFYQRHECMMSLSLFHSSKADCGIGIRGSKPTSPASLGHCHLPLLFLQEADGLKTWSPS